MFYAYSLMISDLSMANSLSNLIWVILSFQLGFTFIFFISPYFSKSHIQGQDKRLVLEDNHRRTTNNEVQDSHGYLQGL